MSSGIVSMSDRRAAAILQDCGEDLVDVRMNGLKLDDRKRGALSVAGLIDYGTEWWHWSFGDRYRALQTKQLTALYGPVELP